jgi:hypothetical protein
MDGMPHSRPQRAPSLDQTRFSAGAELELRYTMTKAGDIPIWELA